MVQRRLWMSVVGLCVALCPSTEGQGRAVAPLGLVLSAGGVRLRPAERNLPVTLSAGDLLFAGDTALTAGGSAEIAFCPLRQIARLEAGGEFRFDASGIHAKDAAVTQVASLPSCELPAVDPQVIRSAREILRGSQMELPADLAANPSALATLMADLRKAGATSTRGLVHAVEPESRGGAPDVDQLPPGPTYALIVGISKYEKLQQELWLRYADRDARQFAEFLESPRGGGVELRDRMKLLTDEEATKDAVREYIQLYLDKAKEENGSFVLVIAAHGVMDDKTGIGSIVTSESDPQDLYTSGVPMDELQEILSNGLTGLGRMLVFVDVCHSANIGTIKSKRTARAVAQQLLPQQLPGKVLSLVSSRETELSWEGENWGGGHGAFSYFVLMGLNGAADKDGNGIVSAGELVGYVQQMVEDTTLDEQHPNPQGFTLDNAARLVDLGEPGITTLSTEWQKLTPDQIARSSGTRQAPVAGPAQPAATPARGRPGLADFETAIAAGNVLPGAAGSAYDLLRNQLQGVLSADQYRIAETELRVALENSGQGVILRYLEGDQVQQRAQDFQRAAQDFAAAQTLETDSAWIESRELFSRGRALIFNGAFDQAIPLLERAAAIDPQGAYSFNALGIAYLEQMRADPANFDLAVAAFEDAIALAPRWAYPQHNLALAYAERGQYDRAIRTYRAAMDIGPDYSYLPYNLGLLYQRTNRLNEAERSFRQALRIAQSARDSGARPAAAGDWQEGADIVNALGSIEASRKGRRSRENAERLFRQALDYDHNLASARHNLALLLSRDRESAEAEQLWRQNLAQAPDDIASRLALADYLDRIGRVEDAVTEYQAALAGGGYPGVQRKLAAAYVKLGRFDNARAALEQVLRETPDSPAILEELADVEARAGNAPRAADLYQQAEERFSARGDRKRVRKKRENLSSR